jgi:ABC-2 type transport system ATP-binding protein
VTLPIGTISAEHIWKRFHEDHIKSDGRRHLPGMGPGRGWRMALQDVNLHVEPGESVGLIGLNGSGKSTLLKILTGAMFPYAGRVNVRGRIGALIEVRGGIVSDLSGRENVFFNGSMLGLTRKQVADRFDAIVEFAELADAIDRQVKHYSSGMQMRLGFSIAAFLEPEVLFVDEALAVGDLPFQQRCLDRMTTVLNAGTTLVFVSHDLVAVQATCDRAVWLDGGVVRGEGDCSSVVGAYRQGLEAKAALIAERLNDPVRLVSSRLAGPDGGDLVTSGEVTIDLDLTSDADRDARIAIGVSEGPAAPIFIVTQQAHLRNGHTTLRCTIDSLPLPRGRFFMWSGAYDTSGRRIMTWHPVAPMSVTGVDRIQPPTGVQLMSPITVKASWSGEGVADRPGVKTWATTNGHNSQSEAAAPAGREGT